MLANFYTAAEQPTVTKAQRTTNTKQFSCKATKELQATI